MMNRRTLLGLLASSPLVLRRAAAQGPTPLSEFVRRNDLAVENYLERQITDPENPFRGALPDAYGMPSPGSSSGVVARGVAALLHEESKFHQDKRLRDRLELAVGQLARNQTPDGNWDLLITNFNSPPDTGFIVLNIGRAGLVMRKLGEAALFAQLEPVLRRAGEGMVNGGVHTPNHRWVVSAALSLLYDLFGDEAYKKRAEEWLMEGIDIDADGQFSEQSTTVYNAVTDDALVTIADKLDKPELLDPVRKNLETMLYLLHPGYEVVTEISHRQDRNTVGDMRRYWYPLRYLARLDNDGRFETLLRSMEPQTGGLLELMEDPDLAKPGPEPKPLPDDYEKTFTTTHLTHIRRGKTSASIVTEGSSRFFAVRRGEAIVSGVRFAAAFFGKGQFVPDSGSKKGGKYVMEQSLEAAYYQPFGTGRKQPWGVESWYELRPDREATEINRTRYRAEVTERKDGFDVRVVAEGPAWIPLAIEVNLRPGGEIDGVTTVDDVEEGFLLESGYATFTRGGDTLRFGPGLARNRYTQVRGAEPKLPGPSVYLTGYTPFDHTLEFRWS